jgi:dTDP-4-dehydrorhamnose reductase
MELTDFAAVSSAFAHERPQLVIHCAALSKTLECERNPSQARLNNVEVTRVLCELAADIPLLFFSTDLVFDGTKGNYNESDAPNPINVYGETKAAAEQIVLRNPRHVVIRASLIAGRTPSGNRSFDEQLRAAWARGEATKVFADEFRSPLTARVIARAIWELIETDRRGLYHLAGAQRLSRLEIAQVIARLTPDVTARIEPCSLRDFAGPQRSPDTSLDCSNVQRLLSFRLPGFESALRAVR